MSERAEEAKLRAEPEPEGTPDPQEELVGVEEEEELEEELPQLRRAQHAPATLEIPDDVAVLEGSPTAGRRGVAVVVSRFNGEITTRLLEAALAELKRAGVQREAVTVTPVPGAFELPLAAMAMAKTRRYACVIALGCVIRGETPHFDFVAGEAASGLQLAALETGVPVAFGVLTLESREQADARIDRAADAVRSGLEMADLFGQLRATAARQ